MEIRKMTISDYEAVYDLWMSCKNMGFNDVDDSREGIERFLRRNPSTNFVAVDEGRIVGVILGGQDGRRGFIHHAAVAGTHRRQGLGTRLVQACLEAMKAEQISKVALLVFKYNDDGNAFWEKQGYTLRTNLNYRNKSLNDQIPQGE
jgi:ribosomal protein S18 acetylase RimI-like enzyme